MKHTIAVLLGIIALTQASLAQETEISREEAQRIPSYDLAKMSETGPKFAGKIVRVKFNYRQKEVTKNADGSLNGTISVWKYSTNFAGSNIKHGHLDVKIPKEGAEWFYKLTYEESRATLNIYAMLPEDGVNGRAVLLGREIKTDFKGSKIIW